MSALLACGGTDGVQTTGSETMPPASEAGEAAPARVVPKPADALEPAPEVAGCLNMVQQQRFQEALTACLPALEVDPDNPEVQAAVKQAQFEAAKLAAAEAVETARREAAARLDQAAKTFPDQPGP